MSRRWDGYRSPYRQLGELYEARGETVNAVQAYSDFADLWRDADPELQPQVEDVRRRIAALVAELPDPDPLN